MFAQWLNTFDANTNKRIFIYLMGVSSPLFLCFFQEFRSKELLYVTAHTETAKYHRP